jgi:phage gp29-like protein
MIDDQREPSQEELRREIASIDRSISELMFYGGGVMLLLNGDSILRSRGRGKGLDIYADLERDAHVAAMLDKRKRAVTAREWDVTPSSDDPIDVQVAELVKQSLSAIRFDKLTKELLDAVLKGYSTVEVVWDSVDRTIVPVKTIKRSQGRFTFDIKRRPRLLTRERMFEGEELPDRKFIVHSVGDGDDGSPFGRGVGHRIFWPVFFKRQNLSFWLKFLDKFGSPTAQGSYPRGALKAEQDKLLAVLRAISNDAGIIVPEGMEIKLLEAAKSPNDGYERLCRYCDGEISKAILGETLTTEVGNSGGSRALGEVHNEVRKELAKDDADEVSYTLNETVVRWIVELNFPGRKAPAVWRNFEESEDLDKVADRDRKLKELGWERTEESFVETYGLGYQRMKAATVLGVPTVDGDQAAEFSEAGWFARFGRAMARVFGFAEAEADAVASQRERNRSHQQTIAEGAIQLAEAWPTIIGPKVKELQTLLDETGDLQLFRDRIGELLDQEPSADFAEQLARATFASRLQGRLPRK